MQCRERKDAWLMQRGEGRVVDNGFDRGRIDIVVDRGCGDVVVDDVDIRRLRQYNK